jgi:hypothetical protein
MKVRIVRDREGQVLCIVPLESTGNEVAVEPQLEEGREAEDVEVSRSDLLNLDRVFATFAKKEGSS